MNGSYGLMADYLHRVLSNNKKNARVNALLELYLRNTEPLSSAFIEEHLNAIQVVGGDNIESAKKDQVLEAISAAVRLYLQGENEQAQIAFEGLFDSFEYKKKDHSELNHYCILCLRCAIDNAFVLQKFDHIRQYIEIGISLCAAHEALRSQQMIFAAYEAQLHLMTNQLPAFINEKVPVYEKGIRDFELEETFPTQLYRGWLVLAYMSSGKMEAALAYTQLIQKEETKPFVRAIGQILEFMVYFEMPDFKKITQFLQRVKSQRLFRSSEAGNQTYQEFLQFADEIATNPRAARKQATKFLEHFDHADYDPLLKLFLTFKLDRWLLAIAEEETFQSFLNKNTEAI